MIKLKPFYRLGQVGEKIYVMSEMRVEELPASFTPILTDLAAGTFDPATAPDKQIEQLKTLSFLDLVYNTTPSPLTDFFEIQYVGAHYLEEQLDYARIKVINHHSDPSWIEAIKAELIEYQVKVVDEDPTLTLVITERLNDLPGNISPMLPVKIGSYRITVGPLINPLLTSNEVAKFYNHSKRGFENESFLVELPAPLRRLSISLAASELVQAVIKVGAHDAYRNLIEWNLVNNVRTLWPIALK